MKKRTGFVSNSSSSSFIIGILNTGKDGAGQKFDSKAALGWQFRKEALKNDEFLLHIEAFDDSSASVKIKDGEHFIYLDGTGPDGDESFARYDSDNCWTGYDYDVDLDDFDKEDVDKYNDIINRGGAARYGAGRNG